jgi:hypothetical protein
MTGYRMTDPFGQVRSRLRQLAVIVAVTVIEYMTGSCGHGHASTDDDMEVWDEGMKAGHEGMKA